MLECLEEATTTTSDVRRRRLLTFCIVGGGPTGVEYAGALAELVRLVMPLEYPDITPSDVDIVLLEGGDRVLPTFDHRLSHDAARELRRRGVEVRTRAFVTDAKEGAVVTSHGDTVETATLVWTAGVRASEIAGDDRLDVDDHLRIRGVEGAYAIGDTASVRDRHGRPLPMTAPPAMQAGRYVARRILDPGRTRPFRYRDKGSLATIGRTAAVAQVGPLRFTGLVGWIVWLVVHLYYLIGFENRLLVLLRWSWYYLRYDRPIRAVIRAHPPRA